METITSGDGTPIAYERTGNGPPLVRVHGTTADHSSWDPVRPSFEDHFTTYVVDRRGRGESGDAAEYALEREFEDVAAVVDSIGEPVTLVGHSYGAICSLEASLLTDNLRRLVLYEPPIAVGDHEIPDEERHAELEALLAEGENEQVLEVFLRDVAKLPSAAIDALRSTPHWRTSVETAHTIVREYAAQGDYEFDASRLEGMTTPTVLLSGTESPDFLNEAIDALDDVLPNSQVVTLAGQGHGAMVTAPELYTDEVLSSLGRSE